MVSIKRIASGEEAGIPLEKKMERGSREGNKSEEHQREFMFRTHGNLWTANWRDGIGIEMKR